TMRSCAGSSGRSSRARTSSPSSNSRNHRNALAPSSACTAAACSTGGSGMRRRSKGASPSTSISPAPFARAAPKATTRRKAGRAAKAQAATSSNDRNQITRWAGPARNGGNHFRPSTVFGLGAQKPIPATRFCEPPHTGAPGGWFLRQPSVLAPLLGLAQRIRVLLVLAPGFCARQRFLLLRGQLV